ncbi:hypothetical protein HMPREF0185_03106 [Brevundimonas diminuta 470-4]|nr:hypothetical protein HMPREF0185_03106 [Brevundimonas diminuta 470-4]
MTDALGAIPSPNPRRFNRNIRRGRLVASRYVRQSRCRTKGMTR